MNDLTAAAEAVLFASGEPLEIERLSEGLGIGSEQTYEILMSIRQRLDDEGSGICLLEMAGKYQLAARKEYRRIVSDVLDMKKNQPLSQAALEVLAVIAYNQPVTKSFVEQIRGVDCSGVVNTLCSKGLIEEAGRLELPGRPIAYRTTDVFLRCFCMESLSQLPQVVTSSATDELPSSGETQSESVVTGPET